MANRIVLNETSYHGAGAIKEIPAEVKTRGFKKAFVCSDPDLIKFGVTKKVTDVLEGEGLVYEIYSDIKPNPTIENVQSGVAAFKASGADYIIAIGGGSSMDTAQAVGIIITNPEFEDVRSLEGVAPTKKPCVPIIAVPTTAGPAAEVTINYVITDVEKKRKFVCVDTHDIPVIAVVDPDMMSSMPKGLTAATGMDALTHAVEAYIGQSTTRETRQLSLETVRLVFTYLERAYRDGNDDQARREMLRRLSARRPSPRKPSRTGWYTRRYTTWLSSRPAATSITECCLRNTVDRQMEAVARRKNTLHPRWASSFVSLAPYHTAMEPTTWREGHTLVLVSMR